MRDIWAGLLHDSILLGGSVTRRISGAVICTVSLTHSSMVVYWSRLPRGGQMIERVEFVVV